MHEQQIVKTSSFIPNSLKQGQNSLLLAIITTFESTIEAHYQFYEHFDTDPMTCDPVMLDWIATSAFSPWRDLWSSDWAIATKRLLLRDTKLIFSKRLFPETITLLFSHFSIKSLLVPLTGFILGSTLLPANLGTSIYSYQVNIPIYYKGGVEDSYTLFIVENFGMPGKIPVNYV